MYNSCTNKCNTCTIKSYQHLVQMIKNSNKALVVSYLKSRNTSVSDLVKDMDVSRNTFYYQLAKDIPDADFVKSFNRSTGGDLLKMISTDGHDNVTHLSTPVTSNVLREPTVNYNSKKGVPYYDVDFMGGYDLVFENQQVKPEFYIDFLPFNDCDCWINVSGKSMGPLIAHGDIVALKKVDNWKRFLLEGEIYAVVTDNGFRTIKMIGAGHDKDHYTLIPYNKGDEYRPQPIPKEVISQVFRVKGNIKKFF